ncbi:MAG TPA: SBBP repeat-containing protein [Chloroflexia bacterium]|nr:SBBP repeat-containing protein [Chloroflexia bacterium]
MSASRVAHRLVLAGLLLTSLIAWYPGAPGSVAAAGAPGRVLSTAGLRPTALAFEPNAGQAPAAIRFTAHVPGGMLAFSPTDVVLARADAAVHLRFLGADPAVLQAGARLPGEVNYLLGADPAQWHAHLPTYAGITYARLYPGVDLAYNGTPRQLKGTYTVAPGADPRRIRWRYDAVCDVALDRAGNLHITPAAVGAGGSALVEQAPVAWQDVAGRRVPVAVAFAPAADGSVGFALGPYDRGVPLTIDPPLTYATYLGGSDEDYGTGLAVDTQGNVYLTGETHSADFPGPSSSGRAYGGGGDVFVSKLNADGTGLVYSTYLGGSAADRGNYLVVDAQQNVYVTGDSHSSDFPRANAYQATLAGPTDGFVAKLDATGGGLLYSTYLGGSLDDTGVWIAVDGAGSAYVTGQTVSPDFPLMVPLQPQYGGGPSDAFVTKLSPTGGGLVYSTYLGGSRLDFGFAITVDAGGNAYLTGWTSSLDFPMAAAFQPTNGGATDTFVSEIDPFGARLLYSSYLGGGGSDLPYGIVVDRVGNAYVNGYTDSTDFPVADPYQAQNAGQGDAYVTKVGPGGHALVYSTYLGGSGNEYGWSVAVDAAGDAFVNGVTGSSDFPLVAPVQSKLGGPYDAFLAGLDPAGTALLFSTYLGGSAGDDSYGVVVDTGGNVYVTGSTRSTDFPVANAYQPASAGASDVYLAKLGNAPLPSPTPVVPPTPCALPFTDVPPSLPFYVYIRDAYCRGIVSGYDDHTFRPGAGLTRGQASKIVSNSAGFGGTPPGQTFADVPPSAPIWRFVEHLAAHGAIVGYACGGPGEPCDSQNRPYFRPGLPVARGQLAKIVAQAAGVGGTPAGATFADVPPSDPFYLWVEQVAAHSIISGYACGGPGEPCDAQHRPYFRPAGPATRGQATKIIVATFLPGGFHP